MEYALKTLTPSLSVTGIVNLHYFEFPYEFYTKSENHPFYELVYVSGGSLTIKSDGYIGELEEGRMILHRPKEYHSLSCESLSAPTVIIVGFTCEEKALDKIASYPITLSPTNVKKLAEIVKEGRNVFAPPYDVPVYNMQKRENPPFGSEQMLKNLLEYFLIGILREFPYQEEKGDESEKLSVSEIVNYINDNYLEKITISELAFLFKTNRSTLCKEFKSYTGKTLVEYINLRKLKEAKILIKNTKKTLTSIAEELNFESIHYFTRFFKKLTGLSPKEYRNSTRKK